MRVPLIIFLVVAAGPGGAQSLPQGRFDSQECNTGLPGVSRLQITGTSIRFYESLCRITGADPVPGIPGVTLFRAACTGEGEQWSTSFIIAPTFDNGVVLIDEGGQGTAYARCD